MILSDGGGGALWDFGDRPTLAVYGLVGSGKTTFLRHVALSWAETGMVKVVVGAGFPQEWDDMSDIVHVASLENAIEYGRFMEQHPWENVVCVIDDADRAYSGPLNSGRGYSAAWTFSSHRPLSDSDPMSNLAIGEVTDRELALGFGKGSYITADRIQPPVLPYSRGNVVLAEDDGLLTERQLAPDLRADMPARIAAAPLKMPLPHLPRRLWY